MQLKAISHLRPILVTVGSTANRRVQNYDQEYLIFAAIIVIAGVSYYKGYNDHRIRSLSVDMVENYAN
jgi:hypothetical protein